MTRYPVVALIFVCLTCTTTVAQSADPNKTATFSAKSIRETEAERLLEERRENARSLLINLAADASKFNDASVRARTLARIADAVWNDDRERSRTMFRAAFDAAEVADREGHERLQADIRASRTASGGRSYAVAGQPEIKREVLRLAARHDSALAEELLAKLIDQQKEVEAGNPRRNAFGDLDEAATERMSVARDLLANGDTDRALQLADQMLGTISVATVDFLSYLREKDPQAADQRYAAMLMNAAANSQSDANTISVLSSYIFTPHMFLAFSGTTGTSTWVTGDTTPPNISAQLQQSFFRAAATVLLRPLPPPDQDQSSSGVDGLYLVIKRLLPLYEQYAAADLTASLKAQLAALSSATSEDARRHDDDEVRRGISPEKSEVDWEKRLLDQIDHAKTADERDRLKFQLANLLIRKAGPRAIERARDYVSSIDDTEYRKSARAYIDAAIAMYAIEKKDAALALDLVKNGELSHFQRAWLLSQTAKLVVKNNREQALNLLDGSAAEAGRVDMSDPDRPRAFLAIANVTFNLNRTATWVMMLDAIKGANSADKFTGEDGQITFRLNSKGSSSVSQHSFPDFDIAGIFGKLADEDYDKAVELAGTLQTEAPRANAVIAIARSVLEGKGK